MTVHLEYKNLKFFKEQFSKLTNKLPKTIPAVHIHFSKRVSLAPYFYLKRKGIPVHLTLDVKKLTKRILLLANKKRFTLSLTANKKLTSLDLKKLKRLKNQTVFYVDERPQTLNHLLIKNDACDQAFTADVYELCLAGQPIYQCAFSSCLGKNVYLSLKGELSFCPEHKEETKIGSLEDETPIFERPAFLKVLEKQIEKRENCKKDCKLYAACRGGCALKDDCEKFKKEHSSIKQKLQDAIENNAPLTKDDLLSAEALLRAAARGNLIKKE